MTIALWKDKDATVVAGGSVPSTARSIDFSAAPRPGWKPFDPTLQPAPGGVEHQLTLHAAEKKLEIAPGVTQEMWTFEGQVPGPVLHGKVGDLFTITLVNDGKYGHSIDFHASKVAWDDEMRTINPGESLQYQFRATHTGIWMYHCGTPPALHHIGNGMYGAVVIDPPDLAPVDHEYVFIQSELYLDGTSEAGLARMQHDQWDAVVFNGFVNQYQHQPIRVEPGQRSGRGCSMRGRRRTRRFTSWGRSSTASTRKGRTSYARTRARADRRHSTCSRRRVASSSSPLTSRGCTPS